MTERTPASKDENSSAWSSPLNWRTTVSPRIKAIGWKRFDMAFDKGEFTVNGTHIYTAPSQLVEEYSRRAEHKRHGDTGRDCSNCLNAICLSCISNHSIEGLEYMNNYDNDAWSQAYFVEPFTVDAPIESHEVLDACLPNPFTSPSIECETFDKEEEGSLSAQDESQAHDGAPSAGYGVDELIWPRASDGIAHGTCDGLPYVAVECGSCGGTTFVLRCLYNLCVEAEAVDDWWRDYSYARSSPTPSLSPAVSQCDGDENYTRHYSDDESTSRRQCEFNDVSVNQVKCISSVTPIQRLPSSTDCISNSTNPPSDPPFHQKSYPSVRWPFRTGFSIWDGCVTLAKFFEVCAPVAYPHLTVSGRRVLELGSGSGILGNSVAALGADKVILTDLSYVLPAIVAGVEKTWPSMWGGLPPQCDSLPHDIWTTDNWFNERTEEKESQIEVAVMDWTKPRSSPAWRQWVEPVSGNTRPIDMVVAADTIWVEELVYPFIDTLSAVRDAAIVRNKMSRPSDKGSEVVDGIDIVIAFERRSMRTENAFLDGMNAAGFVGNKAVFNDPVYGTANSTLQIWLFR
eukprot:GHVN01066015.1.p1 GENE.GHVN01066015.1~~GHVN01066015.1.p1  ORF type:complete len:571 (+),score=68.46 GHVN01066015.1:2690-4402(+)